MTRPVADRRARRFLRRRFFWHPGSWLLLGLLALVAGRFVVDLYGRRRIETNVGALAEGHYQVQRIVDGLTLVVQRPSPDLGDGTQRARVRLLGITPFLDADRRKPDSRWMRFATLMTERAVSKNGVRIRLDRRRIGRDGQFVAYVYAGELLLNEELVRRGLARASVHEADSSSIVRRLRRAEADARQQRRGAWANTNPSDHGNAQQLVTSSRD